MATSKRIYKVEVSIENKDGSETVSQVRLINASNQPRALAHAVKGHVTVEVCSTADAVALGAAGVTIEEAGKE